MKGKLVRFGFRLALSLVLLRVHSTFAAQLTTATPCLVAGEVIQTPGVDDVKPPILRMESKSPENPIALASPVLLQITINSAG